MPRSRDHSTDTVVIAPNIRTRFEAGSMEIVVGICAEDSGDDALALAAVLNRLLGLPITLALVQPAPMEYPSMGNVDAEWTTFLAERALEAIERAKATLASQWSINDVKAVVQYGASVGHGLRDVAQERNARIIVIGPGAHGFEGRLGIGTVAHSLLHGGPAAVAMAPEGYRETAPDHLERIVVGFQGTAESEAAVDVAMAAALPHALPIHLLTVVLRTTRLLGARIGRDPERQVMAALIANEEIAQQRFIERSDDNITGSVVSGDTADRAMSRFDWQDGDIFVVASSRYGVLQRVFLGDLTHKLLRACVVPAIVLPRHTDVELILEGLE